MSNVIFYILHQFAGPSNLLTWLGYGLGYVIRQQPIRTNNSHSLVLFHRRLIHCSSFHSHFHGNSNPISVLINLFQLQMNFITTERIFVSNLIRAEMRHTSTNGMKTIRYFTHSIWNDTCIWYIQTIDQLKWGPNKFRIFDAICIPNNITKLTDL